MAKLSLPFFLVFAAFMVGCQQSTQSVVVDNMPGPSFSGPAMQDAIDVSPAVPAASSAQVSSLPHTAVNPLPHPPKATSGVPADWVPVAKANSWQWIVVHHSATPTGGASAFDKMHKAKGWDELGYHFVIGNGTDTRDGQIEVGSRWPKQKWGAHTKTPDNRFNEHGIGICLVGNFDVSRPSEAQLKSLSKLVSFLMKTYNIPPDHVLGHRDCKQTDCPGKNMSIATVRRMSVQMLADAGDPIPQDKSKPMLASGELLHDEKNAN